ncbi:MAG: hypothetical protein JWO85_2460 [Candidatus Eremiobacteraeota bacterium]|nr:hypothetical protein [Candidatus Eremiobacteraeota bacterium]
MMTIARGPLGGSLRAALAVCLLVLPAAGCSGGRGADSLPALAAGDRTPAAVGAGLVEPNSVPPPGPQLYIDAADGNVYAFPLSASGVTAPSRTITPHPNDVNHQSIQSIATLADGKLAILQNTNLSGVARCRVVVEPANASGPSTAQNQWCDPSAAVATYGTAIARNAAGGFDLLYENDTVFATHLNRFGADGATLVNTMPPIAATLTFATDNLGRDYLLSPNGEVRKYKAATTDGAVTAGDYIVAGSTFRKIAVAPDKTVYVAYGAFGSEVIVAVVNGIVTRTIGPFGKFDVSSLAVDSLGELYVGLAPLDLNTVAVLKVFGPTANGKDAPLRILTPTPRLPCTCRIAIYE